MKNKKNVFIFVIALLVFFVAPNAYATGFTCDCDTRAVLSVVQTAINFIKIIVPVVIVVLAMVDVFKVVTNGKADEGERKKAFTTLATRFVLGVVIFFVPQIVKILFKAIVPNSDATTAIECTLK